MWLRACACLLAIGGCDFARSSAVGPGDGGADRDGPPATCEVAGEHACDGRKRLTCGDDLQWLPASETCDFTCVAGTCVAASNVPAAEVAGCGPSAPRLAPTSGTVIVTAPAGETKLTCSAGCSPGVTEILATRIAGTPGLAWFCLAELDLPAGTTIALPASGGPSEAIALIVDGTVSIAGTIRFDGGSATMGSAGEGAPGASDGGGPAADNGGVGDPGDGSGGGAGGNVAGGVNDFAAGGGGGGGFGVTGAAGGGGRSPSGIDTTGGAGGNPSGEADLTPLVGGSGGGGGGDGSCGGACGWPGGGGGGALQISARASISIGGQLLARGGNGFGIAGNAGGAGGGGAGGAFLLEAPSVAVSGAIVVDGGNGGAAGGSGGAGATGSSGPVVGATATTNQRGGAGGGGAGGRVNIRSANPGCGAVSPTSSCTPTQLP